MWDGRPRLTWPWSYFSVTGGGWKFNFLQKLTCVLQQLLFQQKVTKNKLNASKENVKMTCDGWIIFCSKQELWGETVKGRCWHLRYANILTSAAFSLFPTAAREIHISNASRHTGLKGGGVGGGGGWWYCGRADLIKQLVPQFAPLAPHRPPSLFHRARE